MVTKHFQELEQKEVRAEKEEAQKLKKIAGQIARQVREFWNNIEKVCTCILIDSIYVLVLSKIEENR